MVAITIFLCYMKTLVNINYKLSLFLSISPYIRRQPFNQFTISSKSFFTSIFHVRLPVAPSLFSAPAFSEMPVSHGGPGHDSGSGNQQDT